jgi:hypothetical protein
MTWHTNKNSTPSTSLQEQEAAFSLTSYLDTIRLERAKSNPTQEMSSSPDNETESCQTSQSGTTYAHSTEHPGEEQLMFFAEDSPVRTSVRQVKEQELQGSVRDFGRNMRDSLERCGLALSLPKTHLCFALGDLELSSKTWPRWGIMLDGELSELGMSVRHINETECGSWPTPTTMETLPPKSHTKHCTRKQQWHVQAEANHRTFGTVCIQNRWKHGRDHQKSWPTPTAAEADKIPATGELRTR